MRGVGQHLIAAATDVDCLFLAFGHKVGIVLLLLQEMLTTLLKTLAFFPRQFADAVVDALADVADALSFMQFGAEGKELFYEAAFDNIILADRRIVIYGHVDEDVGEGAGLGALRQPGNVLFEQLTVIDIAG